MAQKESESKRQGKNQGTGTQAARREPQTQQTTSRRESETGIARRDQLSPISATMSPFSLMRRFSEEMDRIFGGGGLTSGIGQQFGRLASLEPSMWLPQVEVFERDGQLTIRADLPGLSREDVEVDVTDDAVVIRGERQQEHEENEEGYYLSERIYGSFYREIPLPDGVNADEATATFRDGVLEITMPVSEEQPQGRQLEIGDGSQQQGARQQGSQQEQRQQGKAKAAGQ